MRWPVDVPGRRSEGGGIGREQGQGKGEGRGQRGGRRRRVQA